MIATWKRVLHDLEEQLGDSEVDGWFRSAQLISLDQETARLSVPSPLHAEQIKNRYMDTLLAVLGTRHCEFEIHQLSIEDALPAPAEAKDARDSGSEPAQPQPEAVSLTPLVLNPEYTFDQYVVGPCNRFAHAAARGVADRPAVAFNPLFLHGSVGLGKTHLMQAIGHHLLKGRKGMNIVFLPCEQFVNHFIGALQKGDLDAFRNRYRQADILVIDDVHLLSNKVRTQEEFFHTFNALHNSQRQIVLSSDSPPEAIPALQERLVSRFKWGLVAEIEKPCFETRVAIVKSKAERRGRPLPEDVAKLIAENIETNIRELEGAMIRIQAHAALLNRTINLDMAREVLGSEIRHRSRAVGMEDVLTVVVRHFGVKVPDLQSKRRTQSIVLPRQVAMFLARKITSLSLEEIGGYFGGRDHSTVVYGLEKMDTRRRVDADFGVTLTELEREVRAGANQR